MAELTASERLQPSLLDRLVDDHPERQVESREERVLSLEQLRQSVLRDLQWLLNASNMEQVHSLEDYPHLRNSVLNYGIPDLTGTTVSGLNTADLERRLRDAIKNFEPRILPHTLIVRTSRYSDVASNNALVFEIEGQMWAQPMPVRLYLRTDVDLDSGHVAIKEMKR